MNTSLASNQGIWTKWLRVQLCGHPKAIIGHMIAEYHNDNDLV